MRTYIFIPPLRKMTGGIAVLYQIAQHLHAAGYDVSLVPREHAPALEHIRVPVCQWSELALTPDDLWLVPEGWVNALAPGLRAGARCVVYVQNWAYLLSALPEDVHWDQLNVEFIAVSDPVAWFTEHVTGKRPPVLRPGIDTALFHPHSPDQSNPDTADAKNTIRIAWMPRKNRALATQIRDTLRARLRLLGITIPVEWQEIHGKSLPEVAALLRDADIFLATGFPEGCPLPPLEALASGCILAGFTGLGGWDYMRQALPTPTYQADQTGQTNQMGQAEQTNQPDQTDQTDQPESPAPTAPLGQITQLLATIPQPVTAPNFALRSVPWGPNALIANDADVPAAAAALEQAVTWIANQSPMLDVMRKNAQETVQHYTIDAQRDAVLRLWKQFADTSAA